MNYFPFDPDPRASAIALDDKRLTRVFHEATMALSRAQHEMTDTPGPYSRKAFIPGALVAWICSEGEGWFVAWTRAMRNAMIERVGAERVHGYACNAAWLTLLPRYRGDWDDWAQPKTFPNLARAAIKGLDFTHVEDTHDAYRQYMLAQWNGLDKRPCVWTHHGAPSWHLPSGIEESLRELGLV